MTPRIDYATTAPEAVRAFYGLEKYLSVCGLERSLIELIKIRCSVSPAARASLVCMSRQ